MHVYLYILTHTCIFIHLLYMIPLFFFLIFMKFNNFKCTIFTILIVSNVIYVIYYYIICQAFKLGLLL